MNVYNEIEPNAAEGLENLMWSGEIPFGRIDGRSIKDLRGTDLADVAQFHTFAGIGGWPLALRLAGWPEDREVWTGSCPCQPFSSAGKGAGEKDARHLWPDFLRLIAERRPATVFGEQVASKAGRQWVTRVRLDLEALGYRVGVADLCAAGVGAPHIRQRLYWVADCTIPHDQGVGLQTKPHDAGSGQRAGAKRDFIARLDDDDDVGRLADDDDARCMRRANGNDYGTESAGRQERIAASPDSSPWSDFRLVPCTDGKARRTGARVFPLAYGLPRGVAAGGSWRKGLARSASRARVGILKGSGNAIVPELAAEFVRAYLEIGS